MNNFTVTLAKDTLLQEHIEFTSDVETRKFIYRQLISNVEKGLLKRINSVKEGKKQVIYSKTEGFFEYNISPICRGYKTKKCKHQNKKNEPKETYNYELELKKELNAYETDLITTLEEAKEYYRLARRFPKFQVKLKQHQTEAKNKSIKLSGRINALQKLLFYTVTEHEPR
jgi:hypothetical protein